MIRGSAIVIVAFLIGFISAMSISGCSRLAARTLTIYQEQGSKTYAGKFSVDTSQLPGDAILSIADTGGFDDPITKIELNKDYKIEVVLRLLNPAP